MAFEEYVLTGGKRLRRGYTTGSCAAAAARAAACLLLSGEAPAAVRLQTPGGPVLTLEVEDARLLDGRARCAVRKDAGDDPDVTDGILVYAEVSYAENGEVSVDGGEGVGRVTRPGLEQPVGAAAINRVPRSMVAQELRAVLEEHDSRAGLRAVISVPGGRELAARTFNPRLGIEGGLSILGTTGIVEPMSEAALVETIRRELDLLRAASAAPVVSVPGGYGETFCREALGLGPGRVVQCSNYVGETLDYTAALGFEGLLLVGHLGKFCKLAGGVFNTHSRVADARMEILCAHAALAGAPRPLLRELWDCATTDAAADLLADAGLLEPVMGSLMEKIGFHLRARSPGLAVEAIVYTNGRGVLGETPGARALLERCRKAVETA